MGVVVKVIRLVPATRKKILRDNFAASSSPPTEITSFSQDHKTLPDALKNTFKIAVNITIKIMLFKLFSILISGTLDTKMTINSQAKMAIKA
jgi:hypothetical protein